MKVLHASVLVVTTLLACSNSLQIAGGTTDTGNARIVACITMSGGIPASDARVIIRRNDYLADNLSLPSKTPATQKEVCTDENGQFILDSMDTGSYTIEVNDRVSNACLLSCKIAGKNDKINLGTYIVHPYAKVEGTAAAPPSCSGIIFLQIYGLERCIPLDATGHFFVSDLPEGCYDFIFSARDTTFKPVTVDSIKAVSGAIAEVPYSGWTYKNIITLNTTSGGADVAGTVLNFPVLIRLSKSNFDFSRCAGNGADIRFTKSNGESLPFEISQWDSANGAAAVWVRLDTVQGNSANQQILIYYGFHEAANASNSAAVFDTSNGFQGVWHFDESVISQVKDATVNGYNGTPYNMTAASIVEGAIGKALDFDGSSSYVSMSGTAESKLNYQQNGYYSISAWVYVDTLDAEWHVVASKGHEQYYLKLKSFSSGKATWEFVEFQDQQGWEYTEDSVPPAPGSKQWVYLTGVRSGSKQYIYINGALAAGSIPLMTGNYPRNTGDDFSIGRYARQVTIPYAENWCFFDGKVDEVRSMSYAPSADWIKLCYMNQRQDDKLVVFTGQK
jgi:hypothetical protein